MQYYDVNFEKQIRTFSGATARMIQHEYDHTEGFLYLDYLGPLHKKLLNAKLKKIVRGQVTCKYAMRFI
jgi:peptide deformylase